jgi:hypothetical protein
MKKQIKKLVLAKETLRSLVRGGISGSVCGNETCIQWCGTGTC